MLKVVSMMLSLMFVVASLASCGTHLPDGIYDEPSMSKSEAVISQQELEQRFAEVSQKEMSEGLPIELSEWCLEEIERYNFIEQEWTEYYQLVESIRNTDDEAELILVRTRIYELADDESTNSISSKKYTEWLKKYLNDNSEDALNTQKRLEISDYLIQLSPDFSNLLEFLPYDAEYDFESKWDMYYSEMEMLHTTLQEHDLNTNKSHETEESKAYKKALKQMDEVKRQYEKGNITAEQGVNAVLNIWNNTAG